MLVYYSVLKTNMHCQNPLVNQKLVIESRGKNLIISLFQILKLQGKDALSKLHQFSYRMLNLSISYFSAIFYFYFWRVGWFSSQFLFLGGGFVRIFFTDLLTGLNFVFIF